MPKSIAHSRLAAGLLLGVVALAASSPAAAPAPTAAPAARGEDLFLLKADARPEVEFMPAGT